MFSMMNAVIVKMLPVQHPEQLVSFGSFEPGVRVVHGYFGPGVNNNTLVQNSF